MLLISKVKETVLVPLVLADGTNDTVTLQGKSKLRTPVGSKIDPKHATAMSEVLSQQAEPSQVSFATTSTGHAFSKQEEDVRASSLAANTTVKED